MARTTNNTKTEKTTTKTNRTSTKNVKNTSKSSQKSSKNEIADKKSEAEVPGVKIKRTRLGRPPKMKTKDIIAAAYDYMDTAYIPSITEFALEIGYERQSLYKRADIEKERGKPELYDTIKKISQLKEVKIEKYTFMGLCPPNFSIFALKQLGWTDKVEVKENTDENESGLAYIAPRLEN